MGPWTSVAASRAEPMRAIKLASDRLSCRPVTAVGHVSCFPHVINLAVQAMYTALKDGKCLETHYLLRNPDALKEVVLPDGVTGDTYYCALKADVVGIARKLISNCCVSGKCREEFVDTVLEGNKNEEWKDSEGNSFSRKTLQLLRDCEIRWSSTHLMVERTLEMLPVCFMMADVCSL